MASLFQRLRSKISSILGRKPKPPKTPKQSPVGHYGIAAGKLPSFKGEQEAQKVDAQIKEAEELLAEMKADDESQAAVNRQVEKIDKLKKRAHKLRNPQQFEKYGGTGKWRDIPGNVVSDFVYDAQPLFVNSSNVAMFQFFKEERKLVVEFLKGGVYAYGNVSEDEAIQIAQAPSKGAAVWDTLRVRGSKTKHKKPYQKIR